MILIQFLLICSPHLAAAIVELRPGSDYKASLRKLKANTVVSFPDGLIVRLGPRLNRGGSAIIFVRDERSVIRLPLGKDTSRPRMKTFREGWAEVRALGVPVIEIHDPENTSGDYQIVERVNEVFDFWTFALSRPESTSITPELRDRADHALVEFARRTKNLAVLGDSLQMLFDGERWRIHDFADFNQSAVKRPNDTVFNMIPDEIAKLTNIKRLHAMILELRACESKFGSGPHNSGEAID